MDSRSFVDLLRACSGLSETQLGRALAIAEERPGLAPFQWTLHLLREGAVSREDGNVILGALASKSRRHLGDDRVGQVLGKYRLIRCRSVDPAGICYEAEHTELGFRVLLWAIDPGRSADRVRVAMAALAARNLPNVAPLQDFECGKDGGFVALRHVDGTALKDGAVFQGPEGSRRLLQGLAQILAAVEGLKEAGIQSCNIRPDTILVGPDGAFRLLALLPSWVQEDGPPCFASAEAFSFMAPEALLGDLDQSGAPLFSVGASFYSLIAGRAPFDDAAPGGVFLKSLREKPSPDPLLRLGLPPELVAAVLKLVDCRPDERFNAALILKSTRAPAAPPAPAPPKPVAPAPVVRPKTTRRPRPASAGPRQPGALIWVAAATAFVLALGLGAILLILRAKADEATAAGGVPPSPSTPPPKVLSAEESMRETARALESQGRFAEALALQQKAHAIKPTPEGEERIRSLEQRLHLIARERAAFDRVDKLVGVQPDEVALRACDEFLSEFPASEKRETILEWKSKLLVRIQKAKAGADPRPPASAPPPPPPPAEPPAPPPSDRPVDAARKPAEKKGVPGRPMNPVLKEALAWLARHQRGDGVWGVQSYAGACKNAASCLPKPGHEDFDTGVSAMACLAFLSAGYGWHSQDEYDGLNFGEALRKGLMGLVSSCEKQEVIGGLNAQKYVYNHALGTYALAEGVRSLGGGGKDDPDAARLREALAKSVATLLKAQNRGRGWRYSIKSGDNDTSITANAVLALDAARRAGATVPQTAFADAKAWFAEVTEEANGRVGYTHKGTGKVFVPGLNEQFDHHEALSAMAGLCSLLIQRNREPLRASLGLCVIDLPRADGNAIDYYYWHYGTRFALEYGDAGAWKTWKAAVTRALTSSPCLRENPGPCVRGSWEPVDRWSGEGGRVYATSLNAMTMAYAVLNKAFDVPTAPAARPDEPAETPEFKWLVHLKGGGQLKILAYEDRGDKYSFKIPAGSTQVPKESVEKIVPLAPPPRKP